MKLYKNQVFVLSVFILTQCAESANLGCQAVKYAFTTKGLNSNDIPLTPQTDVALSICPSVSGTCCTKEMESNLLSWSSQQFKLALDKRASQISNSLRSKTTKIEDFVEGLLIDAQSQFDENFRRTYGVLYEKNALVFTDYFQELKNYYSTGHINLVEITENFFTVLYQKMFQVMNSQYTFDDAYQACLVRHMNEVKPFGEVPFKVASSVKRSMVATRTLIKALKSGSLIADNIKKIAMSPECLSAVQKMNSCPACQGYSDIKPCNNYCLNVMKGCLAFHIEIQDQWDKYVESLMSLTDRLTGPFNVEEIIFQLDISISDAIMNFQDAGQKVTEKAFTVCGSPKLISKRSAPENNNHFVPESIFNHTQKKILKKQKSDLEKLIADLKKAIKPSQAFWTRMPFAMCTNTASTQLDDTFFFDVEGETDFRIPHGTLNNDECWNGNDQGHYSAEIVKDGLANQVNNPEVPLKIQSSNQRDGEDMGLPNIVKEQIYKLLSMTNQLKTAYKGQDVEWWDRDLERRDKSSHSGSFEGSGFSDKDGYEDDEDFEPLEGSGEFPSSVGDFEGSGEDDSDDMSNIRGEPPKTDTAWKLFTNEEIESIQPTTTTTTTHSPVQKQVPKTSGASSHKIQVGILLPTLVLLLASYIYLL